MIGCGLVQNFSFNFLHDKLSTRGIGLSTSYSFV